MRDNVNGETAEQRAKFYLDSNHHFSDRADKSYGQMLWYAWGRMDADGSTEIPPTGTSEGFRLADLWRAAVEDYETEKCFMLSNLMDFYRKHAVVFVKS